jgi:transcriptional regulator with XRE-family HTH domain
MHDQTTRNRFIELRAQGWSLGRIAAEIGVSKPTLINWQRQFQREISDLKSVELEALQEKILASHEEELGRLASHLSRVEAVLAKRNLEVLSTEFLFCMAGALRSQIRRQRVLPEFSSSAEPVAAAPAESGNQPHAPVTP